MTTNFADSPMSEKEQKLFIADLKAVCAEYFEGCNKYALDIADGEKGLSVCIVFDASRVRKFKNLL